MSGRERLRTRWFVAVGVVVAALGLGAWALDLFRSAELDTVDTRFSVRGDEDPPKDLVLVLVDDKTFDDLRLRWPFPREVHGELVNRLSEGGAKAIAYDVQFSEPSNEGGAPPPNAGCGEGPARSVNDDLAFAQAIADAGNVVISVTEEDDRGRALLFGCADLEDFPEPDIYADLLARPGNANIPNDPGGVKRRVPYAPDRIESFAVAVAEKATGKQVSRDKFEEEDHTAWIDFHGPAGTIPSVSFSEAVDGRVKPEFFNDKTVVVGASAPSLQDLSATSTTRGEEEMPGPEIQANAISTVMRDFPLQGAPGWVAVVLIVLFALLAPLLSLRFNAPVALGIALAVGLAYVAATQLAFNGGRILPFVYPTGALVLSMVGTLQAQYFTTAFDRQRVRDMFSRFVPENVVDDVLASADGARLGGVQREGTVMFSDLRGFTSFAESLPVDRVIGVLNKYLSEMSDAILDNGGTLVAYMGDGIMAVFGAPVEQPDHADRALTASRAMLGERLQRFNDYLREEGLSEQGFRMGIGLNSGPVMSGNVGSERRLEYTAIGDTTNTAARLEGMTKGTPHMLYVSDAVREALQSEAPDLVYVGEFEVRGRQAKIKLWSVPDTAPAPAPEHSGEPVPEAVEGAAPSGSQPPPTGSEPNPGA